MARSTFKGPVKSTNGFEFGEGTQITYMKKGTVAVDLASLATVTAADKDITITGAAVGDTVIIQPPAADMTAGLLVCQAWVAAADTVTVRVYNASGDTIDEASANWVYLLIRS